MKAKNHSFVKFILKVMYVLKLSANDCTAGFHPHTYRNIVFKSVAFTTGEQCYVDM